MIIKENDFKLVPIKESKLFDLYLLKIINAEDEDKRREEMKVSKYGVTLENALKHVINYRINKNHETITLKEYIKEYKEEVNKLLNIVNNVSDIY